MKEIDIKNRTCYYFDDIMRAGDFNFDVSLDKKSYENSYENIMIYNMSYRTLGAKSLHIRFDKIDYLFF